MCYSFKFQKSRSKNNKNRMNSRGCWMPNSKRGFKRRFNRREKNRN